MRCPSTPNPVFAMHSFATRPCALALALLSATSVAFSRQEPPPESHELPAILVTGGRLADVPVVGLDSVGSRNVFGPERIRETGARDVNDLLQNLPALSTRPYNGGEAAAPSFSARGLPDDGLTEYLHVLIDGVPASPLPYGWTAFSFFPVTPDRLHALDYVRGAHAVRYSPNTVGGVLNFITQPIPERDSYGARTTFGSFNYFSNMLWAGGLSDDLGWLVSFVDRRGDGYRTDGGFDQQDLNVKLRQDKGPHSWVAGSFSYMDSEHQAPGGLTQSEFMVDPFGNARRENRFEGTRTVADVVIHRGNQSGDWLEGFAYFSLTERHLRAQRPHFPMPGDPLTISDWNDDSYSLGVGLRAERSVQGPGGEHELYGGLRFQRDWLPAWELASEPFPGGPSTPTQDAEFQLQAFSLHLDDTVQPTEDLKLTAGARAEWVPVADGENTVGGSTFLFDDDFFALLPGIGFSYALTSSWYAFGNWFEGFRAPQFWGFGLTPNPATADLDFERSQAFELGTRFEGECGLDVAATLWRNEYDDFGVFYTGSYENLGEILAEGIDLEFDWDAAPLSSGLAGLGAEGSVTLQDAELRSGPDQGNDVPYAWDSKAAWRLRYGYADWTLSLGGTYVGASFSDDANTPLENTTGNLGVNPSRTLWDAQLAYASGFGKRGSMRFSIGATNLFDQDSFVHSRGGFFGGGKVAGPPRQAYVSLELTL